MIPDNISFNDIFVTWLQGQVNSCVAGHNSRLEYLDGYTLGLCHRIDELEKTNRMQATQIEILRRLMERVDDLEMKTTNISQLLEDQRDAHKTLHEQVQVQNKAIENFDANKLMEKIRESDDLDDLISDVLSSSGFASAVQEEVFDRQFTEAIKDALNDMRFKVSVR